MKREINLKDLKKALNKLTKDQLNQKLFYNSPALSISGNVYGVSKAKANLWYTGDDDPSKLYTLKELKENYDKDEIEGFSIEIPKGALVIEF